MKATCPVCELRCVEEINMDAVRCPDHGWISWLLLLELGDKKGWEALIEIRRLQHLDWVYREFDYARSELYA